MSDAFDTFEIPECNLPSLTKEIERLNRRAAKLGVAPIAITVAPVAHMTVRQVPWTREEEDVINDMIRMGRTPPEPKRATLSARMVTITGKSPTFEGWRFGATLDHLPGGTATLLRAVPGETIDAAKYASAAPYCAHCKTKRMRKDTFIMLHEDGREIQVGRQCIKDFLSGHASPQSFANWMQELQRLRDTLSGLGVPRDFSGRYHIPLIRYMAFVAQDIRLSGFLSKKAWLEKPEAERSRRPTAQVASVNLAFSMSDNPKEVALVVPPTPADDLIAADAIAWMRAMSPRGDFEVNLNTLAKADMPEVEHRHLGLLAAGLQSYLKAKEIESTRVKFNNSTHTGVEKERANRVLTVRSIKKYENQDNGFFWVYKFGDAQGRLFSWITSSPDQQADEGQTWEVRATVKAHTEYKGIKETKLSRVAFVKREADAPAPELKQKEG